MEEQRTEIYSNTLKHVGFLTEVTNLSVAPSVFFNAAFALPLRCFPAGNTWRIPWPAVHPWVAGNIETWPCLPSPHSTESFYVAGSWCPSPTFLSVLPSCFILWGKHHSRAPAFCCPFLSPMGHRDRAAPSTPLLSSPEPSTTSRVPQHGLCATPQASPSVRGGFLTCSSSAEGRRLCLLLSEKGVRGVCWEHKGPKQH